MTSASLLDLKIQHTPTDFAAIVKKMGEVFWWEKGKFWVVTSHALAKDVLTSDDFTCDRSPFFISRMPEMDLSLLTDFFAVVSKMMVMSDTPKHTARRRICYDGFTNQTLEKLQPLIAATIERQLTNVKFRGKLDIVSDFATVIPTTILADFFHIPESERQSFYEWSNNMTQFFGGSTTYQNADGIKVNQSAKSLHDYFFKLIQARKANPQDDFLSILLKNQNAFELNDEEIISQAIMMLVAGQVTTTDQICNNFYTLLQHPEALAALQSGEVDLDSAISELNRLDPAVTFIFRVTKCDTKIGEQKIKAGDVIFIATHAVNRDPDVFSNPNNCDFTRKNNTNLAYGYGGHYCLGAKLAQLEMRICFENILKTCQQLRFSTETLPIRKHHSLAFSGFTTLPLCFTAI